jgi:predicted TIM-barrel fold metal-dependent hydrolase
LILDSHCHAWSYWPYSPAVPDPEQRGGVAQLLHEMDVNGVDQALVVSAQIDHNPENNAYVAAQVSRFPERLHQVVDLDSIWSSTYRTSGAADRLTAMAERWTIKGFTHYLGREDDGSWLVSSDGLALFRAAAELGLVASLSCYPHQQAAVRRVAEQFPYLPILCHHLGHPKIGGTSSSATPAYADQQLKEILDSARCANIYIKLSGFYYATATMWDYPWLDVHETVRAIYEHFGPQRMCWGSDYPVVRFHSTYRQALEVFRAHCTFVPDAEKPLILGVTLHRLLSAVIY